MGVIILRVNWKSFFCGFLTVNILWFLAACFINSPILPTPLAVYQNLLRLFLEQGMLLHLGHSLFRMFNGLLISILLGLILGLIMAQSPFWNKILNPFIYFTYPIPKIALLPAVMLLSGLGDASKIIMITLIITFQIIINVRDSVKAIPKETYHILLCLGASQEKLFKEVTLPSALSSILSSVRVALGTTLSILFITETYGTRFGMGFYIMDAWMRVNYIDMYGGIVVLSALGFGLFLMIDLVEAIVLQWRKNEIN